MHKKRFAVYSAIFGDRDDYKEPPLGNYDCFLFTDRRVQAYHAKVITVDTLVRNDPVRTARYFKMLPHVHLQDYRFTLWMDGSVSMKRDEYGRIGSFAFVTEMLSNGDNVVTLKHRHRSCIYSEEGFCLRDGNDDPKLIRAQMDRYRKEGYPENAGAFETMCVLRGDTEETNRFNEAWWAELENGSRRDQLSFAYVARKLGTKIRTFGTVEDNPYFLLHDHKTKG